MKAARFDYARSANLSEAAGLLADSGGAAKIIAGGQSLGPMLNMRLVRPTLLVDIGGIADLRRSEDRTTHWYMGSLTTHSMIEDGISPAGDDPMLRHVAGSIAYRAVRNRGTVGGSLAHADPAADWPLALAARDAAATVWNPAGSRDVAVGRLMSAPFTTVLGPDEIIIGLKIPKLSARARWAYVKSSRKLGKFPHASAAIVVDRERQYSAALIGALDGPPQQLPRLAQSLLSGSAADTDLVRAEIAAAAPELDALDVRLYEATLLRALTRLAQ